MKTRKSVEERFLEKVDKTDTCWLWTAGRTGSRKQYGYLKLKGKSYRAHIVSYVLVNGPVPEGKEVCHKEDICPNKHCVNPEHLYAGTHKENMQDMVKAGNHPMAKKTHCPQGHAYTEENTRVSKNKRYCRTCEKNRYYKTKEKTNEIQS